MESLRELYRIGKGPSSSHTMGPMEAARRFAASYPQAAGFRVTLQGSLAKTGRGHQTEEAVREALAGYPVAIVLDEQSGTPVHPNTMQLTATGGLDAGGEPDPDTGIGSWEVYSVGGGSIRIAGEPEREMEQVYAHKSFSEIAAYCEERNLRLWQYVEEQEGSEIWSFLAEVWQAMQTAVREGLAAEGELPGDLHVQRKARHLYRQKHIDENAETRENRLVCSYAFAVSEQNAGGGIIVTAPTCGACGILPAVFQYVQEKRNFPEEAMLHGLAAAGLVGNLVKTNASISGARCGCQAEIGTACAMAAAGLGEIYEMEIGQMEYAAEIAIEHHLGLTCDPIHGLVQIPCIERNAVGAMRAINAINLANFLSDSRKISFDLVVQTMYETGRDLAQNYRETSEGGLAKLYT